MKLVKRCAWCNVKNSLYVRYHDAEWGVPNTDEGYLYETFILECFLSGLSWECVLNKRDAFRRAYDGFDPERVAAYGESKIEELLANEGIIRNRRKICASIGNSRVFNGIVREYGSFYSYLSTFTDGKVIFETGKTANAVSDAISKDLRRRGMTYVGSVTVYSYLQAIGVIYSHEKDCFLYKALN